MKFNKLRLLGFKSFVEPTEFHIEKGLTGIVGPNGCGKSNLVEALRWVMGENSYKNMRASGMDDVIFSGSGNRPARNTAEVALFLDNADRTAPAAFNDADELQVSRRIERESGSVYRINGKDVRAKDVQLLFADASTGARSPSMVGQGRIGELISAKPQARRALLEEAAGISGLHSRRHEAELRLRAAEANLERLEDVVGQMDSQLESLKRQARQANRYRNLSGEIRRAEALLFHLKWSAAKQAEADAESTLSQVTAEVGERAEKQAQSAKDQAIIANRLPELRDNEAKAAAALQRLTIARNQLDEEISRLANRKDELGRRLSQLDEDIAREERLVQENADYLTRLNAEETELEAASRNVAETEARTKAALTSAAEKLGESETAFGEMTARVAEENARKSQFERNLSASRDRSTRLEQQLQKVSGELAEVVEHIASLAGPQEKQQAVDELTLALEQSEEKVAACERAVETARETEQQARAPLSAARDLLNGIETEARTLNRILNQGGQDLFPAVLERIKVEPGFETALGAALGEDLDVSTDASAPVYWSAVQVAGDPELPEGIKPLSSVVTAPLELSRRLAQIGIVEPGQGPVLQKQLKSGQRLVSRDGALWRWDGLTAGADAPTAAAQKLAQKNRLAELDREAISARKDVEAAEGMLQTAKGSLETSIAAEREARETYRNLQRDLAVARDALAEAERAISQYANRKSALEEARGRLEADCKEAVAEVTTAEAALAGIPDISGLEVQLNELRMAVAQDRASLAEARAAAEGLSREAEARGRRLQAIIGERENWKKRAANAGRQLQVLKDRRTETANELAQVEESPEEVEARRRDLVNQIEAAEQTRKQAADQLAVTENQLAEADRLAKQTLSDLADIREKRARSEERVNSARERKVEIEARIREELECHPADALKMAEVAEGVSFPEVSVVENRLEKFKAERERLGAVNLRADTEQVEITERRDALVSEREDLIEAIRRLRQGIQSLNKEGRERLLEAFDLVNDQFQRLFTHLFGGGTAELQLIESDDPLEAGLEILARPPGKKPQTMTLLSGGEQALTAMALIFAVFLTNPAPICVLDEVDAPLDDHNVERFCNLMDEMASSTDTRFVIITHNPITMARVNRLFGVTMAERGVSQLVSVDLQEAAVLAEAG